MMQLLKRLTEGRAKLAVVGLGYVGLPLLYEFAGKMDAAGFDLDEDRVLRYKNGQDITGEIGNGALGSLSGRISASEEILEGAGFFIIAVQTPLTTGRGPDLGPLIAASETVGRHMKKGAVVVYESTVYPGSIETVCLPALERSSGLTGGEDFHIGYSPERLNPADRQHRLRDIVKLVSADSGEALEVIAAVYEQIIPAGIHKMSSIRAAEAAKLAENCQRDINIAFMNELAVFLDKLDIPTADVLAAMRTKWNALDFTPGLVGGHCIAVDPYYFMYRQERLGLAQGVVGAARRFNESMGAFIAERILGLLIENGTAPGGSVITVFGFTFKENCPDIRNTGVAAVIQRLRMKGAVIQVCDEIADREAVFREYGIELLDREELRPANAVLFAVAHDGYRELDPDDISGFLAEGPGRPVVADLKGIFDRKRFLQKNIVFWQL